MYIIGLGGLVTVIGLDGKPTQVAASALNVAQSATNSAGLFNSNQSATGSYS